MDSKGGDSCNVQSLHNKGVLPQGLRTVSAQLQMGMVIQKVQNVHFFKRVEYGLSLIIRRLI